MVARKVSCLAFTRLGRRPLFKPVRLEDNGAVRLQDLSPSVGDMAGRAAEALERLRAEASLPLLSVDVDAGSMGFFAQLTWLYQLTQHAEQCGYLPDFRLVSANYADPGRGANWFAYFFDEVGWAPWIRRLRLSRRRPQRIRHLSQVAFSAIADLELAEARDLFFRHYAIKKEILREADMFCVHNGIDSHALAVHYRGTDKTLEAERVPYDIALERIQAFLAAHPGVSSVFVASDEAAFIARCVADLQSVRVCCVQKTTRSHDGMSLHGVAGRDPYRTGRGAVLDAVILSRCGTLIRTASSLSGWSCIFNPDLQVVMLNRPYAHTTWFPEAAVLRKATF
jgi:hypothetical protein